VTTKTWSVPVLRHVYGWLLLTPAAILLVGFTHYPAAATLVHSLFSTGTAVRPSRFVGLANYAALADDPVFWQVLGNNFWFALGTIPTSIALVLYLYLTYLQFFVLQAVCNWCLMSAGLTLLIFGVLIFR